MTACIYQILNKNTGMYYIGRTINHESRWADHKKTLRGNRHRNPRLQNSWNFHGESAFEFSILCEQPKECLEELEGLVLEVLWDDGVLYNLHKNPTGFEEGNKFGCFKRSEETKQRMSEAFTGRVFSDEHKARISKSRKGTKASEEVRKKMSEQRQRGKHPRARQVHTPMGIFECQNDAADAYKKSSAWVRKKCKDSRFPEFYLIN
jgi:group I intron endonuclease